ncbi:amidohydrolase [Intrasporangium oryzae NRRL B-24470]|uniref:Amidohydrolase n=1 Tax=Intrasporangium oryzae NRRL B-24470 TaxID=1386089 RepID=W9GFT2_9MICO|nr:amidohydrolase [Intrasporangium oryzae]EWT02739.1 amidohydrolase [Intrasporangium oryzae NRRL B-24470]
MTQTVETIFVGGSLFDPGSPRSRPGVLAVADGRIAAVGGDELLELAGPGTEVVDLAGGLLLPGFQDAHVHPVMAGVDLLRCDLHGAETAQECLDRIAAYAAAHPEQDWITGGGWSMELFPGGTPTRQLLDSVVPDRPVILANRDAHGAWVNTVALRRAAMDARTPDPVDGRIEREPDGSPSGTLHEGAVALVADHADPIGYEDQYAGLLAAQQVLLSHGITAWQDAAVGRVFGLDDVYDVYVRAASNGDLKARVVGALWWDRARGLEQVEELRELRRRGCVGRFRATSVKIMQDGVAENFTAAMTDSYLDGCGCRTGNSGISFVDPSALREYVTRLDAEGFQVHVHALGDRAVREALDAVEAARAANGPTDNRHHLAHLQVVHPDDVPRFAALGATANIQALWACHEPQMDELTIPFLGEDRAAWQYPFGDLVAAGAPIAAGSDWPISSPDPLAAIQVAVTRTPPGVADAPPFYPRNAITLAQALTAYTAGSARINHHEDVTGHLRPGGHADLAVLDRDPFEGPAEQIAECSVTRTYVGGELLFDGRS